MTIVPPINPLCLILRPYLKIQFPLTEDQVWALGLVVYQWTSLENELDMWVYWAHGKQMPATADGKPIGFRKRARLLRELIKKQVREPHQTQFVSLINRVCATQDKRDKLVHWQWGENESGEVGVENWKDPKKAPDGLYRWQTWNPDVKAIVELAREIDDHRAVLAQFTLQMGHHGGFVRLSTAWAKMCGREPEAD